LLSKNSDICLIREKFEGLIPVTSEWVPRQTTLREERISHASSISVYSQAFATVFARQFARAVSTPGRAQRQGFSSWEQILWPCWFCQFAHLKTHCVKYGMGLASCESPLKHLGISSYARRNRPWHIANANRPWECMSPIFYGSC